jgi:hypothetical protein
MKRMQLFEFEDFPWFPDPVRKGITDYLQFLANTGNLYRPLIPIIQKGIAMSKTKRIVDLCSGGGGGTKKISEHLEKANVPVKILLTDKYPNIPAFNKIKSQSRGWIDFVETSVDASAVPVELSGFRTMFVSFHHFNPLQAKKILEDAAGKNEPIAIFEYTEKNFVNFIFCLLAPVLVMLFTPFIRPITFKKLLLTYIIPAIPLFTMWDGFVSMLRTYNIEEMQEMTSKIYGTNYKWEIGRVHVGGSLNILYLLGYPGNREAAEGTGG